MPTIRAGCVEPSPNTPQPTLNLNVNNYLHELELNGQAKETIEGLKRVFRHLIKAVPNLDNPYEAKEYLAKANIKGSTKNKTARTLNGYYKFIHKKWKIPQYVEDTKMPYIPTQQELDALINASNKKYTAFLQLLHETGAGTDEIHKLQWTDIDPTRKTINITPSKRHNGRILPITDKLLAMLNTIKNNESTKIFPASKKTIRSYYYKLRKYTAQKLNNPRIMKITLHTFRHYKGTMEYHKTHDIIHVKTILGHKQINTTMIYINLEQAIFLSQSDEYNSAVAHNEKEILDLINNGWEKVTDYNNTIIFRKRK